MYRLAILLALMAADRINLPGINVCGNNGRGWTDLFCFLCFNHFFNGISPFRSLRRIASLEGVDGTLAIVHTDGMVSAFRSACSLHFIVLTIY